MNKLFVGCIALAVGCVSASGRAALEAAKIAAVRYVAAKLAESDTKPEILFVRDGRGDLASRLLAALADLNAKPFSSAQFVREKPEHVLLHGVDRASGRRGEVVEIIGTRKRSPSLVEVTVSYSVATSVLSVARVNGVWTVQHEEIKKISVAARGVPRRSTGPLRPSGAAMCFAVGHVNSRSSAGRVVERPIRQPDRGDNAR